MDKIKACKQTLNELKKYKDTEKKMNFKKSKKKSETLRQKGV